MADVKVTDELPIGIEIDGKRLRTFTLRAATLRNSIQAAEVLREAGIDPAEADGNTMRYTGIAQRLEIEGLGRKLTLEEMLDLHDRDALKIEEAYEAVEKKLDLLSEPSSQSG